LYAVKTLLRFSKHLKVALTAVAIVAVFLFAAMRVLSTAWPGGVAEPRLAIVNARARLNVRGMPEIGGEWKNFGAERARVLTYWVVATDLGMTNSLVCFGDSASPVTPNARGDFWVELNPTNHVPPWPELVMLMEARYEGERDNIIHTQRWVGILNPNPNSRATNLSFEPLRPTDRSHYLSNFARLIQAKEGSVSH
jgi:hypothetical protein